MDIVIVAAARTAVGKFGGTLAKVPAAELGATVVKALLERGKLAGDHLEAAVVQPAADRGADAAHAARHVSHFLSHHVLLVEIRFGGGSALDRQRHAHAAADAQRRDPLLGPTALHLVQQRDEDAAARP